MRKKRGLVIHSMDEIDDAFVQSSYASTTRSLCNDYNYIFEKPEESTKNLLTGMWSKKVL